MIDRFHDVAGVALQVLVAQHFSEELNLTSHLSHAVGLLAALHHAVHDDLADGCVEDNVLQQVAAVVGEAKGRLLVVLCVQVDLVLDAAALTFALLCCLHAEAEFADDV